jgi:hypothetical protein
VTARGRIAFAAGLGLAAGLGALAPGTARAHEPLWGQTPVTFGAGVVHGEILARYFDAGQVESPDGERMRMFESPVMLDYGLHESVNFQLMVPFTSMEMEGYHHGLYGTSSASGLGDVRLRAKYRFRAVLEPRFKAQHALLAGIKFPTGDDDDMVDAHGIRHDPRDQLGSGKFGTLLGYAYDRSDLRRALWTSAVWRHDLGDGFRLGDAADVDLAGGYWVVRPNVATDFGFHLAAGVHAEFTASDERDDGEPVDNATRLFGIQATPIVTKGRAQFRMGVFVPLARDGSAPHTDFPVELRAGLESFF